MFTSLLIANRGEIACRIMRTARRMGIRTIAVYSDADAGALHVRLADQALRIGPAPAAESYLNIGALIAAARASGAEAVHPGYGFLSERAEWARACRAAGLCFVGPPAEAIEAMGDKSRAKQLMSAAGVPLIPGYHGDAQDTATLQAEAGRLGYPLLIKARAGGGGKGMRSVRGAALFPEALAACQREAAAAFGDPRVLLERLVERPRHVEVQVFADSLGHAVHLFDRDCSVQRRHQKVLEEAPAPGLDPALREAMAKASLAAVAAVSYVGAGTVEFLLEPGGSFYFLEMNTRLQVEHPVTEMITGEDLVEWQLRVAAGEPLPRLQPELQARGHAIEARICAEDPQRGFVPSTGRIRRWLEPQASPWQRIDSGLAEGDRVSPFYDPLLAKLVVLGPDRASALGRLRGALADMAIEGLTTNLGFLERLAAPQGDFAAGRLETGLIAHHAEALQAPPPAAPLPVVILALWAQLAEERLRARERAQARGDAVSAWEDRTGWRLNSAPEIALALYEGERRHAATFRAPAGQPGEPLAARLGLDGQSYALCGLLEAVGAASATVRLAIEGSEHAARIRRLGSTLAVHDGVQCYRFIQADAASARQDAGAPGGLTAPMPGRIMSVLAAEGMRVERGTPILILEAMKMEHTVAAEGPGLVQEILFKVGDTVQEGTVLARIAAPGTPPPGH